MFRKADMQHYKSVLIFGTYVYFLCKLFSIFLSPIPEPLWTRFPVLLFGSYALYKLRKETNPVKFESYAYWLSLITTLDYCYLIYE